MLLRVVDKEIFFDRYSQSFIRLGRKTMDILAM